MYSVARTSSSSSMQHSYYSYHHAPPATYAGASQPAATPEGFFTLPYPFSPPPTPSGLNASTPSYVGPYVEPAVGTPSRGCLKPPSKEFAVTPDTHRDPSGSPLPSKSTASTSRRRANMKLERLPSSAITRIQLGEGTVERPMSSSSSNATPGSKCKTRVLTPYVKSDKDSWLSDADN